nr:amino acid ABC transporter substrate-binding protein [Actinomycetota bacterium]
FPGQLHHLIEQNVGQKGMSYTFSYGNPPQLVHNNVTIGLGTTAFEKAFAPSAPSSVNFLNVAGYNTGVAIQAALANASSFTQLSIRNGLGKASATMKTIEGNFRLNSQGAQVGELLPVSQMVPSGSTTKIEMVYPPSSATAKAVYPAP